MQKWNLREKLGKEYLDCKSRLWQKVNGQSQPSVKVNTSQRWRQLSGEWRQQMTWQWWRHLGLTSARGIWRVTARGGACGAREGSWQRVEARGARELLRRIFWRRWGRVAAPMMVRFPREGRSMEEDLSGTCKNTIGARITTATLWQWSRDY